MPPGGCSPEIALARFLAVNEAAIDDGRPNSVLFSFMYGAFPTPPSTSPASVTRGQLPAYLDDLEQQCQLAVGRSQAFALVARATVHGPGMLAAQQSQELAEASHVRAARNGGCGNLLRRLGLASDSQIVLALHTLLANRAPRDTTRDARENARHPGLLRGVAASLCGPGTCEFLRAVAIRATGVARAVAVGDAARILRQS